MFNATCLIKTDIDTVNKCMGQNPYNPETFLQNFASRLTSFDDLSSIFTQHPRLQETSKTRMLSWAFANRKNSLSGRKP